MEEIIEDIIKQIDKLIEEQDVRSTETARKLYETTSTTNYWGDSKLSNYLDKQRMVTIQLQVVKKELGEAIYAKQIEERYYEQNIKPHEKDTTEAKA